jgi:hypothetical protein
VRVIYTRARADVVRAHINNLGQSRGLGADVHLDSRDLGVMEGTPDARRAETWSSGEPRADCLWLKLAMLGDVVTQF